jgi:predicted Zn-dependent protease
MPPDDRTPSAPVRHDAAVALTRVTLIAVALIACAWFALGIRQVRDQDQAARLIEGRPPTASQAARALRLLDGAATLNPDTQPDVVRAQVALRRGHEPKAERILLAVTRREPENIAAWYLLQIVTYGRDAKTYRLGGEHVRELAGRARR